MYLLPFDVTLTNEAVTWKLVLGFGWVTKSMETDHICFLKILIYQFSHIQYPIFSWEEHFFVGTSKKAKKLPFLLGFKMEEILLVKRIID